MRTTITISDHVFEEAKIAAVKRRASLSSVIEEALRAYLADVAATSPAKPDLPVYGGGGVQPGVDLADPHGLADRMNGLPRSDTA